MVIEDVVADVVGFKVVVAAVDVVVHSVVVKTTVTTEDTMITQQAIQDLVAMLDTLTTSNHKQLVAITAVVLAVVMEQTRVNNKGGGIKTEVVETDTSLTRSIQVCFILILLFCFGILGSSFLS